MRAAGYRRRPMIEPLAPTLAVAALLGVLACDRAVPRGGPSTTARLISDEPQETLAPSALGIDVPVLDSSFGAEGWRPIKVAGPWRVENGSLVIESDGAPINLERSIALDMPRLDTVEVTLASGYKVDLSLSWMKEGERAWGEHRLALAYADGRGDRHRKIFTFDLRSHAEWSGSIDRLRLRLEPARAREQIVVQRLQGLRQELSPEVLAEQSQRSWKVELDREVRSALVVPPGYPVEREIMVPENSTLNFGLGATGRLASPITFRIIAEGPRSEPSMLFESRLTPVERGASRSWRQASVDLGAFGGKRVRLRAESHAADGYDPSLGFPAWANPEIVPANVKRKRPNIILISVDTLRADHLSLYGYEYATSPRIDAWAKRHASVFYNTVAQAPWTLPSHSSMLTGLDALRHGVNHPFKAAPQELSTLAERLRGEGYFTAGINGGAWLHPHYGLAQGFERYRTWSGEQRGDQELEAHAALATTWLGELREPFFLFLHTFDVHDFNAPHRHAALVAESDDPRSSLVQLYDRAVSHMDDQIGGLLEQVESRDLRDRTIVVLTSDHGEDLGEDGVFGHGSLRDQVLLVPLVLGTPDGRGAGREIGDQVRSIDLVPTLLDLAGLEIPPGLDGVSLRGQIEGGTPNVPPVASSYFSLNHGLSLRVRNRWKYLYDSSAWAPNVALYRIPGGESLERDNLAPEHPLAERLRAQARRLLDERLAGLRLRIENDLPSPFTGTIRGDLIRAGVPKSTDSLEPGLIRIADDAAGLSVLPGQRLQLLFERVGEPRFELEAAPPGGGVGGPSHHLAIDLEAMTLPATFRWTGTEWETEASRSGAAVVTLEWHHATALEGIPPFEQTPELRRQLETLGYLD